MTGLERVIAVLISDTHGGHRLGLLVEGVTVYHEDPFGNLVPTVPELNATQRWLLRCYEEDIAAVEALAGDDPIVVLHCGDLTQGVKYKDNLVASRMADQVVIAHANMSRWLRVPNLRALRLISGTASHIMGEASAPILVGKMLKVENPDLDVAVCYHDRPQIAGALLDCAHHGPSSGIREWTQGNQLRYYLRSLVIHDVMRGRRPPDLVVRGHFHKLWPETVRVRTSDILIAFLRLLECGEASVTDLRRILAMDRNVIGVQQYNIVLLPSYCGMGEHGRKATGSSSTLSVGMVVAEIVKGEIVAVKYFEREVDLRRDEVL